MLIGTDRNIFADESAVRTRIAQFGSKYADGLDSVVFSTRAHGVKDAKELAPGVHAYPTNSRSRFLYGWDAIHIARHLPRPDIISAQDPFETGLTAFFVARHFGIPLVVEMHTDFLAPSFAKHSLLNRFRVILAGFVLRRAQGGYMVSERIKKQVQQRYHLTIPLRVSPIHVDTERFALIQHTPHPRFKTALLWVGRLEKEKNPMLALNALARAHQANFGVGLTFVGSGQLTEYLKKQVHILGLDEQVEFVGAVSDVAPYYAHADLLLVTSEYEGYGMALIEALAAGVPVLSTDVGVAREAGATIAEGDYAEALCTWLKGSRSRGVLTLHPYANEEAYFAHVLADYESIAQSIHA
jgi:glycosyltransferase involved in cell wall biosynthesis